MSLKNRIHQKINSFIVRRQLRGLVKIHNNCNVCQSSFEGYNTIFDNCSIMKSHLGQGTYVGDGSYFSSTKIGRYCSIAENVRTAVGNHPTSIFVTTYPSFYYNTASQIGYTFHHGAPIFSGLNKIVKGEDKYQIVIGNDVWLGCNCLILGG